MLGAKDLMIVQMILFQSQCFPTSKQKYWSTAGRPARPSGWRFNSHNACSGCRAKTLPSSGWTQTELAAAVVFTASDEFTKTLCGRAFFWGPWIPGRINKAWQPGALIPSIFTMISTLPWASLVLRKLPSGLVPECSHSQFSLQAAWSFLHL